MNESIRMPQFVVSPEELNLLKAGVSAAIIRPFKHEICDVVGVLRDGVWMDISLCNPHVEFRSGLLKATARGFATPREEVLLRPTVPGTLPGKRVEFCVYSQIARIDWHGMACEYITEVGIAGLLCLDYQALIRANTVELIKLIDGDMIQSLLGNSALEEQVFEHFVSAMNHLVDLGRARIVVGIGYGTVASIELYPLGKVNAGLLNMTHEQMLAYWNRSPSGREHPAVTNPWVWWWDHKDVAWVSGLGVVTYSTTDRIYPMET